MAEWTAVAAKYMALFPPDQHTGGEGEPDPHAEYRVSPYSYLAIDGVTGKYSISMKPKEIPQGFQIRQHRKIPGLRKFKVVKDGAHTYDIVYVGTMMVQNGFAYVSGETLLLEGPPAYLKQVWFTPFAVSYPLKHPAEETNRDVVAQVMEQHRGKLIESIQANSEKDTSRIGIFDFDLTKDLVLDPPHPTCPTCGAKLLLYYEDTRCPVCVQDDPGPVQVDYVTVEGIKSEYENEISKLKSMLMDERQEMKAEIKKMEASLKEEEMAYNDISEANKALTDQLRIAQAAYAVTEAELRELRSLMTSDLDDDIEKKRGRIG